MKAAGRPSRRPDDEEGYERPTAWLRVTLVATTTESFNPLLPAIETAQDTDPLATDMKDKISYPSQSTISGQDWSMGKDGDKQWKAIKGTLTFKGIICVPEALCNQLVGLFHDNPESGHNGALWSAELVSRDI